jgi:hypothetical protein
MAELGRSTRSTGAPSPSRHPTDRTKGDDMSQAFECWDKEDPDRVIKLNAYDARTAAELCAERIWEAVDCASCFEIEVRAADGEVTSVLVNVEARPMFVAQPIRLRGATPPTEREP